MKKVALLGDSIRLIGYGTKVPELLGKDYEVFQPKENCRFVKNTLRMLFDYADELKGCDIIHWNNGLWDCSLLFDDGEPFSSDEEYASNMLRVAGLLKKITPNVIFATTTPVRADHPHNNNADIDRFNAILVPKLKEMGFAVNDLNALVKKDVEKYIRSDDKIHLTEAGIEVCSKQVADFIRKF